MIKKGMNLDKRLGEEYLTHPIFIQLKYYSDFYNSLALQIFGWASMGTSSLVNLDTYTYSSIGGTIHSITEILSKGRINDAYALLRKYYDSTIINVYTNLYLIDHLDNTSFIVDKIEQWRKGTETLPEYRVISQYIKESPRLTTINDLLSRDDRYKKIRNRCNDNTHYNFYYNVLLNDGQIYNPHRINELDIFSKYIKDIFIQHFAYIFCINEHYMMSSDYIDCLDMGIHPEEESKYWVAPFIQEAFDKIIKKRRCDIAKAIKDKVKMQLM